MAANGGNTRRSPDMSSKRHVRRKVCESKIAHHSLESAFRHIDRLSPDMGVYSCSFGSHWHVGHKPHMRYRDIVSRRRAG